ncbi:hypothetical protein M5K25_023989 [Dendrobium thyrsiflorum]|uniref:Uncharacterized protein n=1 Tax=Dendrobium thyrsiflorum TaxID=117978 RepID=A0ABD0U151_DENTH
MRFTGFFNRIRDGLPDSERIADSRAPPMKYSASSPMDGSPPETSLDIPSEPSSTEPTVSSSA